MCGSLTSSLTMEAMEIDDDFPEGEPMEICLPNNVVSDDAVEDMEIDDETVEMMEVDEDEQDVRCLLDGMSTIAYQKLRMSQQHQVSFFASRGAECKGCQDIEMRFQIEVVNRDKRIYQLSDELQKLKMMGGSEISRLRQQFQAAAMGFESHSRMSESGRAELEFEVFKKDERIVFLLSQLELKSNSIGELTSELEAKNIEIASKDVAISILIQEKQNDSQKSGKEHGKMRGEIAQLHKELQRKNHTIAEMFLKRENELLKLKRMENQIAELNKENQLHRAQKENARSLHQKEQIGGSPKVATSDATGLTPCQTDKGLDMNKCAAFTLQVNSKPQGAVSPKSHEKSIGEVDLNFVTSIALPCDSDEETDDAQNTNNNQGTIAFESCFIYFCCRIKFI